jgi:hypothetical protein
MTSSLACFQVKEGEELLQGQQGKVKKKEGEELLQCPQCRGKAKK